MTHRYQAQDASVEKNKSTRKINHAHDYQTQNNNGNFVSLKNDSSRKLEGTSPAERKIKQLSLDEENE